MSTTLYLIQTRARSDYLCPACGERIPRGAPHFSHDPHPFARMKRGQQTSHWCYDCITRTPSFRDSEDRVWIRPAALVEYFASEHRKVRLELARVEVVPVGLLLAERIARDPELVFRIPPAQFEELICDRLYAMGMEPKQVGDTNHKDGGVDIVFWPRSPGAFPFLGVAQVKHHRSPMTKVGPATVRDFAGTIAGQPFAAALLVTNTGFTPDARWFASERARLIRLRGFGDVQRWVQSNFSDLEEWREIPASLELCPGVRVNIRPGGGLP